MFIDILSVHRQSWEENSANVTTAMPMKRPSRPLPQLHLSEGCILSTCPSVFYGYICPRRCIFGSSTCSWREHTRLSSCMLHTSASCFRVRRCGPPRIPCSCTCFSRAGRSSPRASPPCGFPAATRTRIRGADSAPRLDAPALAGAHARLALGHDDLVCPHRLGIVAHRLRRRVLAPVRVCADREWARGCGVGAWVRGRARFPPTASSKP